MAFTIAQINALTQEHYDSKCTPQVYDDDPFLATLKGKNKITVDGGTALRWAVRTSELGQTSFVGPREQIAIKSNDTRTAAELDWKYVAGVTMMHWDEIVKNNGKAAVVKLIGDKKIELEEDYKEALSDQIWGTSTDHIAPLAQIVDSSTTYGGIAVADAASWASTEDSSTTTMTLFGPGSLTYMRNQATFGKFGPTHNFTTRDLVDKFMSLLQPQQRYSSDQKTANMGFNNVLFFETPVIGTPFASAGDWFGLDMDALELVCRTGMDAKQTDWFDLKQQGYPEAMGKYMTGVMNLKSTRRRTHYKFTALDYTI